MEKTMELILKEKLDNVIKELKKATIELDKMQVELKLEREKRDAEKRLNVLEREQEKEDLNITVEN